MATVLHYMQTWLPLSEQFVHGVVSRSRHPAVVVARRPLENRSVFPHSPVYSLGRLFPGDGRAPSVAERRAMTAALALVAARHRPRLVHHHHGYRLRDVEGLARRLRLPLVVSLHGHDALTFARQWPGYFAGAFDDVTAVIVPSRFLAGSVASDLGVPAERIHVIPAGVDTSFFRPVPLPDTDPDGPEALFIGRFVEKKGIDVLLDAWAEVARRVPGARLRLLGFGPLEPAIRPDGVTVEPADPARRAEQVRDAIRRCRVVVTPSRTAPDGDAETLLLVNLEAQASGRPVVSTWHGGIPEYVEDDVTGLLVPEGDPAALADALAAVLSDRPLAERLGGAGPALAARHDVGACTAAVDALYDSILGAGRTAPPAPAAASGRRGQA